MIRAAYQPYDDNIISSFSCPTSSLSGLFLFELQNSRAIKLCRSPHLDNDIITILNCTNTDSLEPEWTCSSRRPSFFFPFRFVYFCSLTLIKSTPKLTSKYSRRMCSLSHILTVNTHIFFFFMNP